MGRGIQNWNFIKKMEKKDLSVILNDFLTPIGYKRKGDFWVINGGEINKMIHLQKSRFANRYFINYGYVINSLPLGNLVMHIFKGFGSTDMNENARIIELLNIESDISYELRTKELKDQIQKNLIFNIQNVNNEEDILKELRLRPNLNDIPLIVKKHFGFD